MPIKGRLTRQDMVAIVKRGESVMHAGQIISREQDLPQDEAFITSEQDRSRVVSDLDRQISELQQRRSIVTDSPVVAPSPNLAPDRADITVAADKPNDTGDAGNPNFPGGNAGTKDNPGPFPGATRTTSLATNEAGHRNPPPATSPATATQPDGTKEGGTEGDDMVIVPKRGDAPEYKWSDVKGKSAEELLELEGIGTGSLERIKQHAEGIGDTQTGRAEPDEE